MPSSLLSRIHRAWVVLGSLAFLGFTVWCLVAYRALPSARAGLVSDTLVTVMRRDDGWTFTPARRREPPVNLLFISGALVDPVAYAPLLRAVAASGYPVHLLALPWRGALGQADGEPFLDHARAVLAASPGVWVVGGHSRGGKVASLLAREPEPRMTALVLVGTTHPRDFSLAATRLAVTKLYGTRDGVAPMARVLANAELLPPGTRWVRIEGGNHSQFAEYGLQPGDHRASIPRARQQAETFRAMLAALDAAGAAPR